MPDPLKPRLRILHLEDNPTDAQLIEVMLEEEGFELEVVRAATKPEFQQALQAGQFDLIVSDFTLPSYNGMMALAAAREKRPELPFIFFSGTIGEEAAVESLKNGATDYVLKHRPQKLVSAIQRALREVEERLGRQEAERALQQREKWFRALTENSLDVVTILDHEGGFKYNSPSVEKIVGYRPEDLAGRNAFDLIHPDDASAARQALQQAVEQPSQRITLEFRFRHQDGSWRNLEAIGQSQLSDPEIAGVVVNSRDITERKRTEQELKEAEQRYRSIFNNAVEGICQTTPDGRFITANPALAHMLGYDSPQDLMSRVQDLGTQVYARPELRAELKRLLDQHGMVQGFACRARKKDGSELWISINARAIRDAAGNLLGHDCSVEDFTERRKFQERIQEQAALLDEAHDAICVTDMTRRILYWNEGSERLYGWTATEVAGRSADDLLRPGQTPLAAEAQRSLTEKDRWEGQLTQATKAGQEIVVESRWTLVRDHAGQPKSILVINTDITERKKTEAQFLRAQRMECIGVLAGGIAHDLNNILAPILMASEILRQSVPGDAGGRMVEIVKSSAERGSEMVKQILSFARGVADESAVIQLKHLVKDVAKLIKQTIPPSVQIQTQVAPELHPIKGNATQIHQVLMNLCVNARDAMPQGGVLRLEVENILLEGKQTKMRPDPVSGPYVWLTVSDTGTGIPAELLDKIFEPFFTTKAEGKGTGLGLPTVQNIVKNHLGFIEVHSEPGKGTSFHIYLPATDWEEGRTTDSSQTPVPVGRGELILVVDDEAAILEISKVTLESHNYRVLTARDGAQGLRVYQQNQKEIKLVITDMMMPIMDGVALIKALRAMDSHVNIVAASGAGSRAKLSEVQSLNVQAILDKPYTTHALLSAVNSILGPSRAP